jgi:LPXTG-motif cell wall-anchored protein
MTVNEYQKLAMTTLNPALSKKDVLINGVMGLCGESGEAIDIVKKHLAQGHPLDREKLIKELGDIAWYLAETATALDVTLEVPITMGDEFQNQVGYLDWEFKVEQLPIEPTDPDIPETGDNNQLGLYVGLMACSLAAIIFILIVAKRRKQEETG